MEITKKCFKCKTTKPLKDFYRHKEMFDGHLGKCKTCAKKDVKDRYNDPKFKKKIVKYERLRFKNPDRKKKILEYARKRRIRFPGKAKARWTLANEVRKGRMVRMPCEVCGEIKSQAHHVDYRKPLDVKWLCFKHHREAHGQKVNK